MIDLAWVAQLMQHWPMVAWVDLFGRLEFLLKKSISNTFIQL
jgi:hypothetical protein